MLTLHEHKHVSMCSVLQVELMYVYNILVSVIKRICIIIVCVVLTLMGIYKLSFTAMFHIRGINKWYFTHKSCT